MPDTSISSWLLLCASLPITAQLLAYCYLKSNRPKSLNLIIASGTFDSHILQCGVHRTISQADLPLKYALAWIGHRFSSELCHYDPLSCLIPLVSFRLQEAALICHLAVVDGKSGSQIKI